MKRRSVFCALIGYLCLSYASASAQETPEQQTKRQADAAWEIACQLAGAPCDTYPLPTVKLAEPDPGFVGEYFIGGTEVVISPKFVGTNFISVIMVHEFTHYIHYKQGRLHQPASPAEICATERDAYTAGSLVALWMGPSVTQHYSFVSWIDISEFVGCDLAGKPLRLPSSGPTSR